MATCAGYEFVLVFLVEQGPRLSRSIETRHLYNLHLVTKLIFLLSDIPFNLDIAVVAVMMLRRSAAWLLSLESVTLEAVSWSCTPLSRSPLPPARGCSP